MSTGPLQHCICCEVSSLIRRNAVWDTIMADKIFFKSMDVSFGRSITHTEGKLMSRISVCSNMNIMEVVQCNLLPGNGTIKGTQCWSLLPTDWACSNGYSQVSLGDCRLLLLISCIKPQPRTFMLIQIKSEFSSPPIQSHWSV